MLDSLIRYQPVVVVNGLAAIAFMIGYLVFGIAMARSPTIPRLAGFLVAAGGPLHLLGFGLAQLVTPAVLTRSIAIVGAASLGAGLAWPGYRLWRTPAAPDRVPSDD